MSTENKLIDKDIAKMLEEAERGWEKMTRERWMVDGEYYLVDMYLSITALFQHLMKELHTYHRDVPDPMFLNKLALGFGGKDGKRDPFALPTAHGQAVLNDGTKEPAISLLGYFRGSEY